jgi:hypothetical protein
MEKTEPKAEKKGLATAFNFANYPVFHLFSKLENLILGFLRL